MTSTTNTKTTADEIWAKLDAMPQPAAAPDAPAQDVHEQGRELVAKIHERKAKQLAREALRGITSGHPRRELHRPKYGKQTQARLPITAQGRLDSMGELIAGRSRRYAQDLDGWARAALADHAERGVLVIWDGMFYTITLDPQAEPRTITEVHRRDLANWRAQGQGL